MIVTDAKDYSADLSARGISILAASGAVLIIVIYLVSTLPGGAPILPVMAICSAVFLLALFLFLRGRGMVMHTPLRLNDDGVTLRSVARFRPAHVPYPDIASLELWWNVPYLRTSRGCSVLSYAHGSITSVETFDRESLKRFVEAARPFLEKKGLKLRHSEDDGRSLLYAFQRDVKKKAVPW